MNRDDPSRRLSADGDSRGGGDLESLFAGYRERPVDPGAVERLTARAMARLRGADEDPGRGGDLESLLAGYRERPVDPGAVERLTARAMVHLRGAAWRRRARRRAVWAAAAVASAAALILLARWPWRDVEAPGARTPAVVERRSPEPGEASRPARPRDESTSVPATRAGEAREPAAVDRALRTTVEARRTRSTTLRELRRGGRAVLDVLVETLESGDGETALAAAQLLASLATRDADAATLGLFEKEGEVAEDVARALVEEALRRRDQAGRRLVQRLLATSAGHLVLRRLSSEEGLWAADLLGEASASGSVELSSEALGLLSHRRPRRAAEAFWDAAQGFASASREHEEVASASEPPSELVEFLRETLPRMSERSLAQLEDDLRRPSRSSRAGAWRATLPAALGRSGAAEALDLLVAILETDGGRPATIRAFGALGDARAVPILERYVRLEDDRTEAAIRALGEIADAPAVRALLSAYLSMGSFPRKRTLLAGSLRDRGARALAELRARLEALPDQRTLDALIELFPEAAGEELARLLPNVDRRGRSQVFRALSLLGTTEAITVLIDALDEPALHAMARQSLTAIAHRDLGARPESWVEWLRDHDPGSRRRADLDSGRPGSPRAAPLSLVSTNTPHHQEEA